MKLIIELQNRAVKRPLNFRLELMKNLSLELIIELQNGADNRNLEEVIIELQNEADKRTLE